MHYTKSEVKDCYVTFPGGAVYNNTDLDKLTEHCQRKKLKIVVVKQNGKIIGEEVNQESDSLIANSKKDKK